MFQNTFTRFEREIQSVEVDVASFELVDHAQRLKVVLEAAVLAHAGVQRVLPGMSERRVAEVVREADGLDEVLIEPHGARHGSGNLRDLEGVSQTRSVEITFVIDEDLGLVDEAAKCRGVDDAVAIALELAAISRGIFRVAAAPGIGRAYGVRSEVSSHPAHAAS